MSTSTHSEYQIVEIHDWMIDNQRVIVYAVTETRTTVQPRFFGLINDIQTEESMYHVVKSGEFDIQALDRIVYLESGLNVPDNLRTMIHHLDFKKEILERMAADDQPDQT